MLGRFKTLKAKVMKIQNEADYQAGMSRLEAVNMDLGWRLHTKLQIPAEFVLMHA